MAEEGMMVAARYQAAIKDKGPEWDDEPVEATSAVVNQDKDRFADLKDKGREAFDAGWMTLKQRMDRARQIAAGLPGSMKNFAREAVGQAFTLPARLELAVEAGQDRISRIASGAETRIQSVKDGFNRTRESISTNLSERLTKIRSEFAERAAKVEERRVAELSARRQAQIDALLADVTRLRTERDEKNTKIMQAAYEAVKANRSEYRSQIDSRQQDIAKLQAETSGNSTILNQLAARYEDQTNYVPILPF